MKRRLFNLAAAVSLGLCVATAALWVRSYRAADELRFQRRDGTWRLASGAGRLTLDNTPEVEAAMMRVMVWSYERETTYLLESLRRGSERPSGGVITFDPLPPLPPAPAVPAPLTHSVSYAVPLTAIGVPTVAGAVAVMLLRRGYRLRGRRGLCRSCGYDLRATPGRCPECGTLGHNGEPPNTSAVTRPR